MTTVPEAISLIQFKLGRRRDLDDHIRIVLDMRQRELEKRDNLPWFLQQRIAIPVVIAPGQTLPTHPIQLPTTFLREFEDGGVYVREDGLGVEAYTELDKVPMEKGREAFGSSRAMPEGYSLLGNYIYLWPAPEKVYTIEVEAYGRDVLPSAAFALAGNSATNLWLTYAPNVLIEDVVREIAMDLRDNDGAQAATARFNLAWNLLQDETIARMEQNNLRTMGEDN